MYNGDCFGEVVGRRNGTIYNFNLLLQVLFVRGQEKWQSLGMNICFKEEEGWKILYCIFI